MGFFGPDLVTHSCDICGQSITGYNPYSTGIMMDDNGLQLKFISDERGFYDGRWVCNKHSLQEMYGGIDKKIKIIVKDNSSNKFECVEKTSEDNLEERMGTLEKLMFKIISKLTK